jgi:N-acetylglucosamine-6-phosphate deacetylase
MDTPLLFDFQVNGFGGVDFQRDGLPPAEWARAAGSLRSHGVRAFFAAFVTAAIDRLCRRLEACERACSCDSLLRSQVAGYHLEGPWLSPDAGYRGAHPPGPMHAPSAAEFDRLQDAASGRIRLVTLAPEWPGSPEFIAYLVRRGVHASLGHTNASEPEIDAAIRAGARFATHLGNGVPQTLPRHDNVVQRLLARDELTACFIPDGIHLPPFVLRSFVRAKPAGRVLFTTDCMSAAGAGPGRYTLGELEIDVGADGAARMPGGGGLAGSTLTPDEGVRRVAAYLGLSGGEALRLWSDAPAAAFGVRLPA